MKDLLLNAIAAARLRRACVDRVQGKQGQSAHVVVQLSAPSPYVSAACWQNRKGVDMVHPLFIKEKLNALLFTCAVQKGLSEVLMEMLSFEGAELKILVRSPML